MRYQKKIDFAQQVVRTGHLNLFLLGEIAEIEKAESSVGDQNAHGARVLSIVDGGRRFGCAVGIRFSSSGQRTRDVISRPRSAP